MCVICNCNLPDNSPAIDTLKAPLLPSFPSHILITLAVISARLSLSAKVRYMGARVEEAATAARFLARLAGHTRGRKAYRAYMVAIRLVPQ